ncbi:MAG: tetratricopeptide repeat protein [Proteobacteria bacterium]|nr:tetratricopeptide repeat protein [Pseudomonadota bacterium]
MSFLSGFIQELRRRNVFRVAAVYVVTAWLVMQIADTMFPAFQMPAWTITFVAFLLVIGFPIALLLSWAFEMTPDGLKREKDVERAESVAVQTGNKLNVITIALLGIAAVFFALDKFDAGDQEIETAITRDKKSIAVIPFENISGDPANDPFTIGIHDDLLTQLSRIGSLKTISRTSMLQYRNTTKTIPQIARELGVATILEGGVQRSGDRIRINAQLIDGETDTHLWAATYDRQLTAGNIFAIQTEIAMSIAEALEATLTEGEQQRLARVPTESLAALDAYFLGKQLLERRNRESLMAAVEYFEEVIKLDPDFALGHSGLADAYMILPEYDENLDLDMVKQKSIAAVNRALELDPNIPEVLASRGWDQMIHHYDWTGAEQSLRRALEIESNNANALHWLSHVLSWQGRVEEGLLYAERAVEVDPLSPLMGMNLSYILVDNGRFDEAIKLAYEVWERDPGLSEAMGNLWLALLRGGRVEEAIEAMQIWAVATHRDQEAIRRVGQLFLEYQQTGERMELPADLLERAGFGLADIGQVYAFVQDAENTLIALDRAVEERSGSRSVLSMKVNPLYDFIRDDPRFVDLMARAGLEP